MKNIRLSVMLYTGFSLVALIAVLVGTIGLLGERTMEHEIRVLGEVRMPAVLSLNEIDSARQSIHAQTLESLLFPQITNNTLNHLKKLAEGQKSSWLRMDAAIKLYSDLPQSEEGGALFRQFNQEYSQWKDQYRELDSQMERLSRTSDSTEYETLFNVYREQSLAIAPLTGALSGDIARMVEYNRNHTLQTVSDADASAVQSMIILATIMILGFLVALACGWFITRHTLRLLGGEPAEVMRIVDQVAEGDLTIAIKLRPGDSDSLLARFDQMIVKIRRLMKEVSEASLQVSAAAEELSASSAQTNAQVQLQQAEITQVATAMNQMTATVLDVASNASAAARAAQSADSDTSAGMEAVSEVVQAINNLAKEVESITGNILKLVDDSKEIGGVLDVIQSIAEQTNLLALNAAIEAARAGDHGRGFAVVADEVRSLASRTQDSTEDIKDRIDRVQNSSALAANQMEEGQSLALQTVEKAGLAGDALKTISAAVASINDMNAQIATAAEEQSSVAEEINRNVSNITQAIDETATAASQVTSASQELAVLSASLQRNVQQFKIS
ncbi:HAMP domain-containing methyl-accepting chemotaxis protein [Nitrincola sp. MINF-07-Sa-05]|uniref:HAMP domain-containing methyl-accepting chemotaxis protein n=1 Tax=Nitrincola salilacus TaxID=3400273 RepID=UPI0039185849